MRNRRRLHRHFFLSLPPGVNLRFPDPSLTEWQFLAAVFTMLYVVYRAPDTRLAFTAFFFVALMFGMLRHGGRKLAVLGSVSLLAFALVIWLRYANNGDAETLRLDMLQLVVLVTDIPMVRVHRRPREATSTRPQRQ